MDKTKIKKLQDELSKAVYEYDNIRQTTETSQERHEKVMEGYDHISLMKMQLLQLKRTD